jgi:hypothetical protein
MTRLRRTLTLLVFASALAAAVVSCVVGRWGKSPVEGLSSAPWLSAALMAYAFATFLVPFGLADIREAVPKTLKIWGICLIVAVFVWVLPLALAPTLRWSADDCLSVSLMLTLLPTLCEPMKKTFSWFRRNWNEGQSRL